MPDAAIPPFFQAELRPHRSLGRRGYFIVIGLVAVVNLSAGAAFWLAGAWPVFGFAGLEVLLLWLAFRYSYAQGRAREYVTLADDSLIVRRISARGQETAISLQPYWVRVECAGEDEGHALTLWSHGRAIRIGVFLSPEERLRLADALQDALWRWRQPPGGGLREVETA